MAAVFTDEHRATLDWLNEITDESFRFFGLEVELWRIGDSHAAPKFNIVSKPNDWTRSISQAARRISDQTLTETKSLQLEYWTGFRDQLQQRGSPIRPQKPSPQHWMYIGIGRAGFVLGATLNSTANRIAVGLFMRDDRAKAYFWLLHAAKEEIEAELGHSLEWKGLPDRKASRILYNRYESDPLDKTKWPEDWEWMRVQLESLDRDFRPRIRALNADEWVPETADDE